MSEQRVLIPTAPVFRPLTEPARYKGAFGGRGSGKSHFFADLAVKLCVTRDRYRIVCVREVQKRLKDSVKLNIEDKIEAHGLGSYFDVKHDRIDTLSGGTIIFQGMSDSTADSIKSLEGFDVAYVEESQSLTKRSLELLRPTIRKPNSELWFSWNPRNASDPVDRLLRSDDVPPNSAVVRANFKDNPFFPDVLEQERLFDKQNNPDRYAHIWEGEYEPIAVGAIWNRQMINDQRRAELPDIERVVVGVDPAVSSEEGSNEHGIVVCALGADGRGYVIDDVSRQGSPKEWADRAISAYDRWEADAIVIEINQGGDMVRHTLESMRPNVPVIEVRATKGKHVRAEPIAALYSGERISHVGAFPTLEDQMCQMTAAGYEGEGSPDHVDAMVWAFTELFPQLIATKRTSKVRVNRPTVSHGWLGS